jgi:betaine lipid synthase
MVRWLFNIFGLQGEVRKMCEAQTLAEQREIWPRIRRVLMSRPLHWAIVSTEWFAWKAAGVPRNQRNMIVDDFFRRNGLTEDMKIGKDVSGQSIWEYVVNTLDPVVNDTLISNDNYFYFLCVQGKFSRRCVNFKLLCSLLLIYLDATLPIYLLRHMSSFLRLVPLTVFVSTLMRSTR